MKYYIVALFDEESYETILPIQRNISKKYKGYRNSPIPHVTLSILDNPNIEKLTSIVEKVISPYKKFKIELNSNVYISDQLHSLNLQIENRGYITKIKKELFQLLELHGFNDLINLDSSLSISIANINHSNKDSKRNEMSCDLIRRNAKTTTLKINKIEIWKFSNNRRETPLKSFILKNF